MPDSSAPNKVFFPRKELSELERRIRKKLQERNPDQEIDDYGLGKDEEVELEKGEKKSFLTNLRFHSTLNHITPVEFLISTPLPDRTNTYSVSRGHRHILGRQ